MKKHRFSGFEAFDKMEDFFNDFIPHFERRRDTPGWTPRVDVRESESEFVLDFEIPGVKKEEVEINVDMGRLSLSGERKRDGEAIDGGYSRTERRFGRFSRTFDVPDNVDADKIEATMAEGVLTLKLPKIVDSASERGRKINID